MAGLKETQAQDKTLALWFCSDYEQRAAACMEEPSPPSKHWIKSKTGYTRRKLF